MRLPGDRSPPAWLVAPILIAAAIPAIAKVPAPIAPLVKPVAIVPPPAVGRPRAVSAWQAIEQDLPAVRSWKTNAWE